LIGLIYQRRRASGAVDACRRWKHIAPDSVVTEQAKTLRTSEMGGVL
jgi:hypothetical protein